MAEKKKQDLGKWEKPEETFEKRKRDQSNLLNVISAIDSMYTVEVANILKKRGQKDGKKTIDYSYIEEGHKNYDAATAKEVREAVDKVYDLNNELHPLKDVIPKDMGKDNFYLLPLINNVYFKHRDSIRSAVGHKDFMQEIQQHQEQNLRRVRGETLEQAVSDIDNDEQRKHVAKYLIDKHGVDEKKLGKAPYSHDLLHRNIHMAAARHLQGALKADDIYETARVSSYRQAA